MPDDREKAKMISARIMPNRIRFLMVFMFRFLSDGIVLPPNVALTFGSGRAVKCNAVLDYCDGVSALSRSFVH